MAAKGKKSNTKKKKTVESKKSKPLLKKSDNKQKNTVSKSKNSSKKSGVNNKNKNNKINKNKKKSSVLTVKKKVTNNKKTKVNKVAKSKPIKKKIIVKKVDNNVSDSELLDKILEESKQKKLNKKKLIANKNQVKNAVVIDILKEEAKKDDLIITKEIDLADLEEYLTRESQIIESDIDREVRREYSEEDLIITESGKKEKNKRQKDADKTDIEPSIKELVDLSKGRLGPSIKLWNIVVLVVLVVLLVIVVIVGLTTFADMDGKETNVKKILVDKKALAKEKEKEREEKARLYEECITKEKNEFDTSEEINNYVKDLNEYFAKYHVSIKYYELSHGFDYSYNADKVYYAASTIKALDGLYIYSKAAAGEISLDDTVTYTTKYNLASSYYMSKHKYGEKISVRDLVKYAITRSDNRAHQMLVDFIGLKNLKEYGLSLGATKTLAGDIFGAINVDDAVIYWKEISRFINTDEKFGKELESYFLEADQNYLNISDGNISAIHKYGEYENYYHDIGIVYTEKPYIIAILSTEGKTKAEEMIRDINMKISELNELYNSNREKICHNDVYK